MDVNAATIELVKSFERLVLVGFQVKGDVPTIGFGHTSSAGAPRVRVGMTITEQQAYDILETDISTFAAQIRDRIKVDVNADQFGAVVSLAYNVGAGRIPTLLNRINRGDFAGAAEAFLLYNRFAGAVSNGLVRRRKAERYLFLSDYAGVARMTGAHIDAKEAAPWLHSMPQTVEAPKPPKSVAETHTGIAAGGGIIATVGAAADQIGQNTETVKETARTVSEQYWIVKDALSWIGGIRHLPNMSVITFASVLVAVGCFAFIIWDRHRKLKEDLV